MKHEACDSYTDKFDAEKVPRGKTALRKKRPSPLVLVSWISLLISHKRPDRPESQRSGSKVKQHTPTLSTIDSEEEVLGSLRREIKREASNSSNEEFSAEDHSWEEDSLDEEEAIVPVADPLDLFDDVPTKCQLGQPLTDEGSLSKCGSLT